jgi:hypothetical protein
VGQSFTSAAKQQPRPACKDATKIDSIRIGEKNDQLLIGHDAGSKFYRVIAEAQKLLS